MKEMTPLEIWVAIGRNVKAQLEEGGGIWRTCTGCHESEDGHDVGHYPHSRTFGCKIGGGCHECGGLGVIWDDTDYAAMGEELSSELSSTERK